MKKVGLKHYSEALSMTHQERKYAVRLVIISWMPGITNKALFWFELAAGLKKPEQSWGFFMQEFWGFIPNIQLSVCSFKTWKYGGSGKI